MDGPSGGSGDLAPPKGSRSEPELEEAHERLVDQGRERLDRPLLPLLSTGLLGGVDVGVGVLIYLVAQAETDNHLLASLAFSIGFVALLLAKSELSTENFLVPVTAVIAKTGTLAQLVRLWVVTSQPTSWEVSPWRPWSSSRSRTCTSGRRGRLALRAPRRLVALVLPGGAGGRRSSPC